MRSNCTHARHECRAASKMEAGVAARACEGLASWRRLCVEQGMGCSWLEGKAYCRSPAPDLQVHGHRTCSSACLRHGAKRAAA